MPDYFGGKCHQANALNTRSHVLQAIVDIAHGNSHSRSCFTGLANTQTADGKDTGMPRHYCIDIGGSFVRLAVGDGQTLNQIAERPTPVGNLTDFLDGVTETVLAGGMHASDRLGISITGSIDASNGTVQAAHLPFLTEIDLAANLENALGQFFGEPMRHSIIIQNDADCFAQAEARFGAGKDRDNVFAIIIGTGIGGAQVYRNRLIRGFGGAAGEWGHGPFVQKQDPSLQGHLPQIACSCGQTGCINTVGGARGLEAIHLFHNHQTLDSRQIVDGWISGDKACRRSISSYISIVSDALAVALNITGAEIVPVGGGMSSAGKLLEALNGAVQQKVLLPRPDPLLVRGKLGEDGGLWGIYARMLAESSEP